MAGRKIRDRADAEACLMAAEAAGVPLTEYAQQEGVGSGEDGHPDSERSGRFPEGGDQ